MSRFNEIKVGAKDGFATFYDPVEKRFILRDPDGNEVGSGITQEKTEGKISELLRSRLKLPVRAIFWYYGIPHCGRVTSATLQQDSVWFAWDDKKLGRAAKVHLGGAAQLWELTPANEQRIIEIGALQNQAKELQAKIGDMVSQLEKPISREYFKEAQS